MSTKVKLTILNFFQLFVWGAWLITIAHYWFGTKQWDGKDFGLIFSTMGIASLFMPTIMGIVADRWVNAERLYGILQIAYGATLVWLTTIENPNTFFWVMLLAMCFYMPTLALNNSISYTLLKRDGLDVVKDFPPIRVFGTVGFIAAMWVTNLLGFKATAEQFYVAAGAAIFIGLYAFTLPKCPPSHQIDTDAGWTKIIGLDAFKLFKSYKMALFFIFSIFLGAALQLTNAYGDVYIDEFKFFPVFADSIVVKRSTLIMSISQISETAFILAIPFFLKRFGIKTVMLISMFAWVFRFALLGWGDPGSGLWMIILSCIVYGMAFDFFNISGSLFVETSTNSKIRASAQGLFMMMTNGVGAVLGSYTSGEVIDTFFTKTYTNASELAYALKTDINNAHFLNLLSDKGITIDSLGLLSKSFVLRDWYHIWMSFAIYALIIAILFAVLFKHKNEDVIAGKS